MLPDCVGIRNQVQNVWQASTKLSTFKALLTEYCRSASTCYGIALTVNERALTGAFFSWTQTVESCERYLRRSSPDYFQFLVGSLLAELLKARVVEALPRVEHHIAEDDDDAIAKWWPAGFTLTHFCAELVRKIIAQECGQIVSASNKMGNIKVWQSFRENMIEEASIAIAYFDDFMGVMPDWRTPSFAGGRAALR